jgi:hypothetical protein
MLHLEMRFEMIVGSTFFFPITALKADSGLHRSALLHSPAAKSQLFFKHPRSGS